MGKITHTIMNGGTLEISNLEDFHKRYVEKILTGEKQYIVELKTDPFKFYIDFDYKGSETLAEDSALEIFKQWEESVSGPVYVARARPRMVDGLWKSGFHLVWPERTVTKATYTRYKNSIVLSTPSVKEFIDEPTSGLRILWSHKHPVGKPYLPWICIHKGVVKHLETVPNSTMLSRFSIRASEETTGDQERSESSEALENFIRKYIRGHSACNVKKILKRGEDLVIQTDSTYCENLGDRHKSNHVWFIIHDGKISQKCHCKCDVVRKKGKKCKDFTGTPYRLPLSVLEDLQPDVEEEFERIDIMTAF